MKEIIAIGILVAFDIAEPRGKSMQTNYRHEELCKKVVKMKYWCVPFLKNQIIRSNKVYLFIKH